jgi:hypothetical protein
MKDTLQHTALRPIFFLLIRATLWMPIAILPTLTLFISAACIFLLPLIGLLYIYVGDTGTGLLYLAAGVPAFFIAKFLKKLLWETPPSLL